MTVTTFNSIGLAYTKLMLKTQVAALKRNLTTFHHYATQSGFGVDARGVVTAAPSVLNAYYASHSGAVQFANAPLALYEELLELFGRECFLQYLLKKLDSTLQKASHFSCSILFDTTYIDQLTDRPAD